MLYQVVTGEIREGDLRQRLLGESKLSPVEKMYVGRLASDYCFPIFRPVKVPSEEEMLQAVVNHCQKEIDCENCHSERECYQCYYKTMLQLMGLEEVEG